MQTGATINAETLLPWSQPKVISGKFGLSLFCKAEPTDEFKRLWRDREPELRKLGIRFSEYNGRWEVTWWRKCDDNGQLIEKKKREKKDPNAPVVVTESGPFICEGGKAYIDKLEEFKAKNIRVFMVEVKNNAVYWIYVIPPSPTQKNLGIENN